MAIDSPPARAAGPVASTDRIVAIDVLRGFAVLGILVMNIMAYAMIRAAYGNPAANEKLEGAGLAIWVVSHILAELKLMAVFSMLFGAGIVLMSERAEARGANVRALHYRRQLWLLMIGLVHGYLIWYGDILASYAQCAMLLFWFRRRTPRTLLIVGSILLIIGFTIFLLGGIFMPQAPPQARADQEASWKPPVEEIALEVEAYRGSYLEQMPVRSINSFVMHTMIFGFFTLWRAGGLMLIGMALFKLGVFSAERSDAFYRRTTVLGLGLGFPLVVFGAVRNVAAGFSWDYSMMLGMLPNYVGSLGVAMGYVGLVMLAVRRRWLAHLQLRLAAVGRMALTNYVAQTLICTTIFYGHGLGLFEKVERPVQAALVLAVWAVQLWWSPWWLARYRFGPLEWLWRSLTYRSRQPMSAV